jgi:hypothetical protein
MQISLQILNQKHRLTAAVLLAAGLLAGCATPSAGVGMASAVAMPAKAEDAVRARAQQRWDWLVTGKYEDAYTYTTPAFRGLNTAQNYRNRFGTGASWTGARVQSVECAAPERCTVQVAVDTRVVARGFRDPITTSVVETWLLERGQWWYHQAP